MAKKPTEIINVAPVPGQSLPTLTIGGGTSSVGTLTDAPGGGSAAASVTVMLTCNHVYLPEDPTREDWEGSTTTVRYDGRNAEGRRNRIGCHPSLAEFLQSRDQAEII